MKHKKFKYKWISLALITAVATTGISAILISCKDNPRKEVEKLKDQLDKNENQTQRPTFSKPSVTLEANTKLIKKADNKYELKLKISNANNKLVKVQLVSQVVATSSNNNLISDFANVNNGEVTAVFSNLDEDTSYNLKSISLYANKADKNPLRIELSQSTKATQLTVLKADNHDNHTDHKDHDHSNHKMNEPKKNDSKKEAEKPPVENSKASAPVATGEYKISFADPNNVIYQKGGKWYIKLKIENGEGHRASVQLKGSTGNIDSTTAEIKDNILEAELKKSLFSTSIRPGKKYKLGRIDITNQDGKKTEIRSFDSSISGEIIPMVITQQSNNSNIKNSNKTTVGSIAAKDTGIWFENNNTEVDATLSNGKYSFKAYIEKAVKGSPTLTISKNKNNSNKRNDTFNASLKDIEVPEPGKGELQDIEIPDYLLKNQIEDEDGKKVYITQLQYLNDDLEPIKTINLSSKVLIVKIPKSS